MGKILRHKTDSGAEYCTMEDDDAFDKVIAHGKKELEKYNEKYKAPAWKGLHYDDEIPRQEDKYFDRDWRGRLFFATGDIGRGDAVEINLLKGWVRKRNMTNEV